MKTKFIFSIEYLVKLAILLLFSSSLAISLNFGQWSFISPIPKFSSLTSRTANNELAGIYQIFFAERYACYHQNIYNSCKQLLQYNTSRKTFYREVADIFFNTGIEFTHSCKRCNIPTTLSSVLLTLDISKF